MHKFKNSGPEEMKYLTFSFNRKAFTEDDEYYYFKGYASTFGNEDAGGDVVMPGAFRVSLRDRMPKLCWQHNIKDPVGVFTKVLEDEKGLYVEGKMPKDNTHCRDIASLIKCGAVDSMSIGYSTINEEYADNVRYLKEVVLYEVSFVTIPMNDRAKIDLKSVVPFQDLPLADKDTAWNPDGAQARTMSWKGAEKPFLWIANGKAAFLIADVINEQLVTVPRAIFAAAAALQSGKGCEDIPEHAQMKIKQNLSRYYQKMGLVAPWDEDNAQSQVALDGIKTMKEINEFLRSKGLSNIERTAIIAKIKHVSGDTRNEEPGKAMDEILRNAEYIASVSSTTAEISAAIKKLRRDF